MTAPPGLAPADGCNDRSTRGECSPVRGIARVVRARALTGARFGLAAYLCLLAYHVHWFRTIEHAVPNVATWAGRYPGFGFTWELTALNVPARLVARLLAPSRPWIMPQRIRAQRHPPRVPASWNAGAWVTTGALGYVAAGSAAGGLWALLGAATLACRHRRRSLEDHAGLRPGGGAPGPGT